MKTHGANKKTNDLFDVTMGSNDSSEIAELVGLYLLHQLGKKFGNDKIGLYRDDGLAILPTTSGPKTERARKDLIALFKENHFEITSSTNLLITDFLDVTFNLKDSKFYPYRKENNNILYVNAKSNHPPSILKQIPDMVGSRLSVLSCNSEEFKKAKPEYQEALKNNGYQQELKYDDGSSKKRKKRSRKIIWFNPPYNENVQTNIGKLFLNLIKKHFPPHHRYRRLFNKNTIKLSYSCMENVGQIIKKHNAKILRSNKKVEPEETRTCNCSKKNEDNCPMSGQCLKRDIVYKAEVKTSTTTKIYYGCCDTTFKKRFANHKKSFKNRKYEKETSLATYIWHLKDQNQQFEIAWSIHSQAKPYQCGSRKCSLCIAERLAIIQDEDPTSLINERSSIISWCPHRHKHLLKNS